MDLNKSKAVTTSVPSISIKFHANAEQIEELHASGDEIDINNDKIEKTPPVSSSSADIGESDSSPLKYLPRLVKRSTSIDVSQAQALDASPPSDPWKFFSDMKVFSKITKSVEEKITEYKARNQEEGSPHHKVKTDLKSAKDSKESSSISDSEDLSESSISKTCGIVSTTEGVEMSSDEDTPSLDKDKKPEKTKTTTYSGGLRQRFKFLRNKTRVEEGTVKINNLSKLYNINTEKLEQALPEDSEDVESAVDALEETYTKTDIPNSKTINNDDILQSIVNKFDNIDLDSENVINIKETTGEDVRNSFFETNKNTVKTVFAPTGFVDLRPRAPKNRPFFKYLSLIIVFISMVVYIILHQYSPYIAGFAFGIIISFIFFKIYLKLYLANTSTPLQPTMVTSMFNKILEIQAVKEYQPLSKYEGWANEYPDIYDPNTYHISQTQSVFLRLQGNLLRLSHSKSKVPKRAMWNESEIKATFSSHRIYNLHGAKVNLLPEGLAKIRQWSKKYPICITLAKNQMNFDPDILLKLEAEEDKQLDKDKSSTLDTEKSKFTALKDKRGFNRFRKKEYPILSQRFSKLTEDEEFDLDSDSRASTPSADISDVPAEECPALGEEDLLENTVEKNADDLSDMNDDWSVYSPQDSPSEIKIYIFGRTDREKEDWFRRLTAATHKGVGVVSLYSSNTDIKESVSSPHVEAAKMELEYLKYMSIFKASQKQTKLSKDKEKNGCDPQEEIEHPKSDVALWLNALIGRVLFDCVRDPNFTLKVRERIQRKLSTIKLPYFIEELLMPELSLGKTPPFIHRTSKPVLDERGLWIDLDITYEGLIILTLQTKLNLMRLKNPQAYEKPSSKVKPAIYHSDVDDSAESSSDEDGPQEISNFSPDTTSSPLMNLGSGSSNSGKKFIKMVDRIAESRIFQAATEYRYIKKAMEGVSNTDLRLTVEIKAIVGTLVLNIPPPPSDRIWVGFRPIPEILLSARPVVGERNISYIMITSWIEKKLIQEFQKIMVIPNMEDFVIPVMNPKLPE